MSRVEGLREAVTFIKLQRLRILYMQVYESTPSPQTLSNDSDPGSLGFWLTVWTASFGVCNELKTRNP